ncbi:MAG TPA: Asp23/Gls24 family envelope stress response protein [Candidatus Limosilactobacillus merdipullorum]|uniref:Asp23/Gls24 family envelope stress response protein n=1 Tax=Candidatus Limosilactobacillus merdipullorum TaxID=2838653 RepID=A0A9D1U3S4_9LACO|nr:Asp23/Gls24 family envelope stress response protein [Candidatus Limosilactobacillus merdipullorum]
MAKDSNIVLNSDDQSHGTIQISPQVLEIIAGIAASEVDGVAKMHGSLASGVSELFGRQLDRRGVKLSNNDDQLAIDVDVYVQYGVSVPTIAAEIQNKVKQQVSVMTGLTPTEVNVHIRGIVADEKEQSIDQNDIFGLHSQEEKNDEED